MRHRGMNVFFSSLKQRCMVQGFLIFLSFFLFLQLQCARLIEIVSNIIFASWLSLISFSFSIYFLLSQLLLLWLVQVDVLICYNDKNLLPI